VDKPRYNPGIAADPAKSPCPLVDAGWSRCSNLRVFGESNKRSCKLSTASKEEGSDDQNLILRQGLELILQLDKVFLTT